MLTRNIHKKILRCTYIIIVWVLISSPLGAFAQNVNFPDANLAVAVRSALGLAEGADIPLTSLQGMTQLFASNAGITNLTGLEQATSLRNLQLNHSRITNLTPLSGLTSLTSVELRGNPISDFTPLSNLTNLTQLKLIETGFSNSDISILSLLINLTGLDLSGNSVNNMTALATVLSNMNELQVIGLVDNGIMDITAFGTLTNLTELTELQFTSNQIRDISPLSHLTSLTQLFFDSNQIRDVTPLASLTNLQWRLRLNDNQISNLTPLRNLTKLRQLYFKNNRVSDISPLETLTELLRLDISGNQISNLRPLASLTKLQLLSICYNPYTDISPIGELNALRGLQIDEVFVNANRALVEATTTARLFLCPPEPEPEPELEPEPEPEVKRRRYIDRCGLGWSPQPQYHHRGALPKVMMYALEFEYDPESHGKYICKTVEIRTGDDAIENLAGWKLYLGTRYNPSHIPITIPEEHSQITDRVLRLTPEMLGLETFPCNTVYVDGISHPLPGVHYVLKTDENILVDTAYSCFVWGQNAYTTVDGVNVESPRRISSAALREMDTPRIERYIMKLNSVFITYTGIEEFEWDRVVLSDWLLAASESSAPGAPSAIQRKLLTTWGALKKQ